MPGKHAIVVMVVTRPSDPVVSVRCVVERYRGMTEW